YGAFAIGRLMNINQVLQNLTDKKLSTEGGEVSNELDSKLAELLKQDPESFEKVMASLEEGESENLSEELKTNLKQFKESQSAEIKNIQMPETTKSEVKVIMPQTKKESAIKMTEQVSENPKLKQILVDNNQKLTDVKVVDPALIDV